jgi:hypothetical protein
MSTDSLHNAPADTAEPARRADRRNLLRLAGAAAVAGTAASLIASEPASAAGTMLYGTSNNAGIDSTSLTSTSSNALEVINPVS